MAEDARHIVNTPEFADSGSPARVAFDLMRHVEHCNPKPQLRSDYLNLYAECLRAVRGLR